MAQSGTVSTDCLEQNKVDWIRKEQQPFSAQHLMVFDMACGGHHGSYIYQLILHWSTYTTRGCLTAVVSPQFLTQHTAVVDAIPSGATERIQILAISDAEFDQLQNSATNRQYFKQWQLWCQYAEQLQVDHCLLMQFDPFQLAMIFGRSAPCPFSGIYFRPAFHYGQWSKIPLDWKAHIFALRQRVLLSLALRNAHFSHLFSLDPYVVSEVIKLAPKKQVVFLPDPVTVQANQSESVMLLREKLGVAPDRKVLLLFGHLDERKGIAQVLEALASMSEESCQKLTLLLVGSATPEFHQKLVFQIRQVIEAKPIQILLNHSFVPESAIAVYFQLADLVLAPYQKHIGMSGIFLLAAVAYRPLLSTRDGLLGRLIQQYEMGWTIDAKQPSSIAQGINEFLQNPYAYPKNPDQISALTVQHSSKKFAQIIIQSTVFA